MHRLRVLLADDEPGMTHAVRRVLAGYTVAVPHVEGDVGFDTDTAHNGAEAIAKLRTFAPHILLLDYKMPDMTGLEVLEKAGAGQARVLTIMITAYASIDTAISAMKRGAYDFLAKPFSPDELKNILRKAAGQVALEEHAARLAQEKRQVRFNFISVLGHELKAPLSAVTGYLRMLKDPACRMDAAAVEHSLDRCLVRTEQMEKLIADLLDLTRIESGQAPRELASLRLSDAVRAALDTVRPEADARGITLHADLAEDLRITADRREIEIILNNLLTNAVKYNRDGGRVDVSLVRDDARLKLTVADTGIGMSPAEVAGLFGEFVRIRNDKTRDILGSGLGLSIVKKIVTLYGGDVAVRSTPDVGSAFTITLPLEAPR